ncbi:hypothetical protein [Haloplanus salilacus]|uniref:hypothetical protein n=1 Tax=Haloplanus salilacus TaxID=2949994 RepID=UPI0030CDC989
MDRGPRWGMGVGGQTTPLLADTFVALAVNEIPPFDALYRDTLFPTPISELAFRQATTGFDALENGVHRVGHRPLLALLGIESFGGDRETRFSELAPTLALTVIFSGNLSTVRGPYRLFRPVVTAPFDGVGMRRCRASTATGASWRTRMGLWRS